MVNPGTGIGGEGPGDEDSDRLSRTSAPSPPAPVQWRLAPGVWPVEGTVVGGTAAPGEHAYTLVLPNGRRYQVSEALYRLAELLASGRSLEEVAARLSEWLGRPIAAAEVEALVERKLVPQRIATVL